MQNEDLQILRLRKVVNYPIRQAENCQSIDQKNLWRQKNPNHKKLYYIIIKVKSMDTVNSKLFL